MKIGGIGGGKTITGLNFERKVDFQKLLGNVVGYEIKKITSKAGMGVYFQTKLVARYFRKSVNCHYIFNELPLAWLGLPTKKD